MRNNWRVARRVIVPPRITGTENECLRQAIAEIGLPWVAGAALQPTATAWMSYDDRDEAIGLEHAVICDMRRRIAVGNDLRQAAWNVVVAGMAELRKPPASQPTPERDIPAEWLIAYVNAGGGINGSFAKFCRERGYTYPVEAVQGPKDRRPATPVRRPLPTGPSLPPAPSCNPDEPLVIRRRGEGRPAHA